MAEFDENGNIIKKGVINAPFETKKKRIKKGKGYERSYIKLDPRG